MADLVSVTSGVGQLDQLLGGLFIGDNVVWHDDAGSLAWTFCLNFLHASQREGKPIIYVSFDRSPKVLLDKLGTLSAYPNLTVMDCFTNGKGASSNIFTKFYEQPRDGVASRVVRVEEPRDVSSFSEALYGIHEPLPGDVRLVFESLTGMEELWGSEEALVSFYSHSCPRLYELETIAFWIMEKNAHSTRMKAQISQIAQVVLDLAVKRGTTSLTILKAEKRDISNLQKPYIYWTKDHSVVFDQEKRTTSRLDLGHRIKEMRTKRGLSQTELAKMIGVTPSTISQVENNLIYPSLPALLKVAEVLRVEAGSFFRETPGGSAGFIFKADDYQEVILETLPGEAGLAHRLTPIDFPSKTEPFLIEINAGESLGTHFFSHKGEEFGFLVSGLLELKHQGRSQLLVPGDVVYLTSETPSGWKNPGPDRARLLWVNIG
jgi:transcriptional regulator with XRE-family HTH domain